MTKILWERNFEKLIDFYVRRPSIPRWLSGIGASLIFLALSPFWSFAVEVVSGENSIELAGSDTDSKLSLGSMILGVILLVIGVALAIIEFFTTRRIMQNSRRLSVEVRGLDVVLDKTLEEHIRSTKGAQVVGHFFDVRGKEPKKALAEIVEIPRFIGQMKGGKNNDDISLHVGGLAPVPYLFLMGVLLTSQSSCEIMDWHRDEETWKILSDPDDGLRFEGVSKEELSALPPEIVLTVSTSYEVDHTAVESTFPNQYKLHLSLIEKTVNTHWSEEKQKALAAQLRDLLIELGGAGVELIHLVLASQASVAIRFGRQCHTRNLPELRVYQFEKTQTPQYPWSVKMPRGKDESPEIIITPTAE